MKKKFVASHAFAIFVNKVFGIYAFSTPHAYTTSIPSEIVRVEYEEDDYYRIVNIQHVSIPSVILFHGVVAFVTVFFHAFIYIPCHYFYGHTIWSQGFFPIRWVEYGVTCTIMSISSISSAGRNTITQLVSVVFLGIGLQSLGAAIEQRKELVYFLLFVGGMISLGIFTSTMWYLLSSTGVTAAQVLEFLSYTFYYSLFPINCALDAIHRKGRFEQTDWIYIILSMSSKIGLFWLQVGEVEKMLTLGWWPDVQIYGLGIVFPLVILALGIHLTPSRNEVTNHPVPDHTTPKGTTLLRRACTFRVLPNLKLITETRTEHRTCRRSNALRFKRPHPVVSQGLRGAVSSNAAHRT